MDPTSSIHNLLRLYSSLSHDYGERGVSQVIDGTDKENQFKNDWDKEHYFSVGSDALRIVISALITAKSIPPTHILDFPCGSGRVTRHLKSFFSNSEIYAYDLYGNHVDFCMSNFNVKGGLSKENLDDVDFDVKFDLIFCGSLLTHLPEPQFIQCINLFIRSLQNDGLAIITLQGRYSDYIQDNKWKYIHDDFYKIARDQVNERGFGYVDYDHDFKSIFNKQQNYGITLIRPSWVLRYIENHSDVRILKYIERDWDNHQDVLVIQKQGMT